MDTATLATDLEASSADDIVAWAAATFGNDLVTLCAMTSDAVLVDLVAKHAPGTDVVFLDTGHHFTETLETHVRLRERYGDRVNFVVATSGLAPATQWQTDPDGCCHVRKVEPMESALSGRRAWITGMRRADSSVRADTPVVQTDKRGLVKVNPIATWSDSTLAAYLDVHEVPQHPLLNQGYPSIGCEPCTRRIGDGEDLRAGRWAGKGKTECGLHL
jgi:phosphoadenosine phosphosulfate reductase